MPDEVRDLKARYDKFIDFNSELNDFINEYMTRHDIPRGIILDVFAHNLLYGIFEPKNFEDIKSGLELLIKQNNKMFEILIQLGDQSDGFDYYEKIQKELIAQDSKKWH